jgi:probable phosphoglycerate mutase
MTGLRAHNYDKVLVVSHGAFLSSSIKLLTGTPIGELRPGGVGLDNNTLTVVEDDGQQYILRQWNDTHGR